jgi:hypothetical protein
MKKRLFVSAGEIGRELYKSFLKSESTKRFSLRRIPLINAF